MTERTFRSSVNANGEAFYLNWILEGDLGAVVLRVRISGRYPSPYGDFGACVMGVDLGRHARTGDPDDWGQDECDWLHDHARCFYNGSSLQPQEFLAKHNGYPSEDAIRNLLESRYQSWLVER
jgi:hypothetical protein